LQKRPIILRSLLIVATSYRLRGIWYYWDSGCLVLSLFNSTKFLCCFYILPQKCRVIGLGRPCPITIGSIFPSVVTIAAETVVKHRKMPCVAKRSKLGMSLLFLDIQELKSDGVCSAFRVQDVSLPCSLPLTPSLLFFDYIDISAVSGYRSCEFSYRMKKFACSKKTPVPILVHEESRCQSICDMKHSYMRHDTLYM